MKKHSYISIPLLLVFFSCSSSGESTDIEKKFIKAGLVDVHSVDPGIKVDLVNSDSKKNYFRKNFYGNLSKCYVRKETAYKLKKAQAILKNTHPSFSLLIYDGARPRSVSYKMYDILKNTPFKNYVADPRYGSMHNYGAAIDIVIVDENGQEIDMGPNPFRKNQIGLLKVLSDIRLKKKLTNQQERNRNMLRTVMVKAGFHPINLEWWHFNVDTKTNIRRKYRLIE